MTLNEEDNGIELWRALFIENEGGAEQVQLGGMNSLHSFPPCPGPSDLQHWIGQWQICRQKFGHDLPEIHLRQMFLNMLPHAIAEKLRERRDISTLQEYINGIHGDIGRLNDARLAKVHAQRMKTTLASGAKNPIHAVVGNDDSHAREEPNKSPPDVISKTLDGLIAALATQAQNPRGGGTDRGDRGKDGTKSPRSGSPKGRPDSRFKGCLHCGDPDHFRRDCPEFNALISKNNGKLPIGYRGKSERWKENQKKKGGGTSVSVLHEASDEEFPETQNSSLCH